MAEVVLALAALEVEAEGAAWEVVSAARRKAEVASATKRCRQRRRGSMAGSWLTAHVV